MPNPRNYKGTSLYGIRRSLVSHSPKGSRPRPPKEHDEPSGLFDQFPPERALKHFEKTAKSVLKAYEPPKHPKVTEALSAFDKPLGRGFKRFESKLKPSPKVNPPVNPSAQHSPEPLNHLLPRPKAPTNSPARVNAQWKW